MAISCSGSLFGSHLAAINYMKYLTFRMNTTDYFLDCMTWIQCITLRCKLQRMLLCNFTTIYKCHTGIWSVIFRLNIFKKNLKYMFKQSLGRGILDIPCPSVDVFLSKHVLKNWCMEFSENLFTHYSSSEFSFWLHNFKKCSCFDLFWA